jgi:hypothetical protein
MPRGKGHPADRAPWLTATRVEADPLFLGMTRMTAPVSPFGGAPVQMIRVAGQHQWTCSPLTSSLPVAAAVPRPASIPRRRQALQALARSPARRALARTALGSFATAKEGCNPNRRELRDSPTTQPHARSTKNLRTGQSWANRNGGRPLARSSPWRHPGRRSRRRSSARRWSRSRSTRRT